MAQNAIQKYPNDDKFITDVLQPCETFYNNYQRLEKMSNFLNSASVGDYPASDYPKINSSLSDLSGLRTAINTYMASTDVQDFLDEIETWVRI